MLSRWFQGYHKNTWLFASGILVANAGWGLAAHAYLAAAMFGVLGAALFIVAPLTDNGSRG